MLSSVLFPHPLGPTKPLFITGRKIRHFCTAPLFTAPLNV